LACKDVCVLESETLTAVLPLVGADLEASETAFRSWRSLLPIVDEKAGYSLSVTGGPVPQKGAGELVVWLNWDEAPAAVEFFPDPFPDPGPGLKAEGVRVQTRGKLTRIDLTLSRLQTSTAPATKLRGVIVTRDTDGDRRATVASIDLD
jgi:hypothetical protein